MTTPVAINGALVAFDPLILKGPPGDAGQIGRIGPPGPSSGLTMGTVTTLPPGSQCSASITGIAPNQKLNLQLAGGSTTDGGGGGGGGSGGIDGGGAASVYSDDQHLDGGGA